MDISFKAVDICRQKLGKDVLCGFENLPEVVPEEIPEDAVVELFDELVQNELIDISDTDIHISPLGQHMINMMTDPEALIVLENRVIRDRIRVYIRDAFYLCISEEIKEEKYSATGKMQVEYLPGFEEIVGAFAYAVYLEEEELNQIKSGGNERNPAIVISGKAWEQTRRITTELAIHGIYQDEKICCQIERKNELSESETGKSEIDASTLVNYLTKWMFDRLADNIRREEKEENGIYKV